MEAQGTVVMATVKGDVHDIGKNIVGVVLGCNNYRVIDLGVMVPVRADPRDAAVEEQADMIGLSGLITPSLDEMVNVAAEMERRGMSIPLLIGGATTSRQHTAVKIAPAYSSSVTHVLDASRAVGVVARLLDPVQRAVHEAETAAPSRTACASPARHPARARAAHLRAGPGAAARASSGAPRTSPRPSSPAGGCCRTCRSREIAQYIDWTFFFHAWELRGKFPEILDHPSHGAAARELYANATAMLDELIAGGRLTASGVYGLWPANTEGEDIVLYADAERSAEVVRLPMLRQQRVKADDKPQYSLADFVAPRESGLLDHVGAFAVTAGLGAEELAPRLRGGARRLLGDHGQGARRPAGRGLRRDDARPRAPRVGLRRRRGPQPRGPGGRALPRASARPSATPPAPTTSPSAASSSCWTPRPSA